MAAREEEKAMAGLLRRSLAQDAATGADCPEPETLAAYFDRALDVQETARYDLHFSRCSLCREQLAAMARAAGGTIAAEKKTAGSWIWLGGPRWLMPAAAVLVVLVAITGIALRMTRSFGPGHEVAMLRHAAGLPEPALADQVKVQPSAPSQPEASSAPAGSNERAPSNQPHASDAPPAKTLGPTVLNQNQLSSTRAAGSQPLEMRVLRPPGQRQNQGAVGAGAGTGSGVAEDVLPANSADQGVDATAAAPPSGAKNRAAATPAKKSDADSLESDTRMAVKTYEAKTSNVPPPKMPAPAAPAPQSAKAMNLASTRATDAAALARMKESQLTSSLMNLQIHTPDPQIIWMISGAGSIEKSENGGANWKSEYLDTSELILAGSAPTVKICWLVGGNGAIQRTTNGTHWKTVPPPAETNFVRVDATDALNATVTALDGRKFSTSDGGKSWNAVK
jgi:hypothetical protein